MLETPVVVIKTIYLYHHRAAYHDAVHRRIVSGGRPITRQFVKLYVLNDMHVTVNRKIRELVLSLQMTHEYPKAAVSWTRRGIGA